MILLASACFHWRKIYIIIYNRIGFDSGAGFVRPAKRCFEQFFYPVPVNHGFDAVKKLTRLLF
jgi:hypothetical protein